MVLIVKVKCCFINVLIGVVKKFFINKYLLIFNFFKSLKEFGFLVNVVIEV